jgi:hypothetical protein
MLDDPPPSRSRARGFALLVTGFLLAPMLYDATRLCVAGWRSMGGAEVMVETPVLDTVGGAFASMARGVSDLVRPAFVNIPWKPSNVFLIAGAWAFVGILMLRSRWN